MSSLRIYSDESGIFDRRYEYFIFGSVVFKDKESYDHCVRIFNSVEKQLKTTYAINTELKGSKLRYKDKKRLIDVITRFASVFIVKVKIKHIKTQIFDNKKTKQRYLDYAYKMGLKKHLINLNKQGTISLDDVREISLFQDEHTTATNGIYELKEAIYQEFKCGTFNYDWDRYYEPIIPQLSNVQVKYCDSKKYSAIRMADICANLFYSNKNQSYSMDNIDVIVLP